MVIKADTGCKVKGDHLAVGYWGRDIHARIFAGQEHARQRALLTDQILAGSIRADLWLGLEDGPRCGCYKESNRQSDRKCSACHGVGVVPGYRKFGYETLWLSGVDTSAVLTNVQLTKAFRSAKMELVSGALTGTLESADMPFARSVFGSKWEVDIQSFELEPAESSVVAEYSLNSGTTWDLLSNLETVNPLDGTIRFRVTLTRISVDALSPMFEILRARYARIALTRKQPSGEHRMGPWILVMREPPTTGYQKQEYGDIPIEDGLEFWTAGLSLFDPSIELGTAAELIEGPSVLIDILDGARAGNRYVATSWKNSDPFGYMIVSQTFKIRIADDVGPYSLVW